jgi:ElaB/YqjD/DUF883 family membrane-anchored ribosome-binding protein
MLALRPMHWEGQSHLLLEDGEVSLERAKELREEGEELLAELRTDLDVGDGNVIERE